MEIRKVNVLRLVGIALLLSLAVLFVACGTGSEQNTLSPEGDVARKQRDIFFLAMWPAAAILVIVQGLLIFALVRYRRRRGEALPTQVHGNMRLEIAWTIAPTVLLFILAVPMVMGIFDLGRDARANAFGDPIRLNVTGFQWNWSFEYPDITDADGNPLRIIGQCPMDCAEAHIPVGREIGVTLESADVIHSFWVPKLAGKVDAIPGRTNKMWFNALEPGVYSGQCAEFCGLSHSDMRLFIVAESEEEFETWVREQLGEGQAASSRE